MFPGGRSLWYFETENLALRVCTVHVPCSWGKNYKSLHPATVLTTHYRAITPPYFPLHSTHYTWWKGKLHFSFHLRFSMLYSQAILFQACWELKPTPDQQKEKMQHLALILVSCCWVSRKFTIKPLHTQWSSRSLWETPESNPGLSILCARF